MWESRRLATLWAYTACYRDSFFRLLLSLLLLWFCSPLLGLGRVSVYWSYAQSVGLLGRGRSPSQGLYLHTEQHKHRINAHNTDIHALRGIRTHDPSVWAGEDSSCLRPPGHYDRFWNGMLPRNSGLLIDFNRFFFVVDIYGVFWYKKRK
jgi:hypothetical protein